MASICLQWEETDEHLNIAEEVIDKLDDFYSTDDFLEKLEQHALPADRPPQTRIEDDFVMLEKQDAIEAMAYYIASFVQQSPEAQSLDPKQLQQALRVTFQVKSDDTIHPVRAKPHTPPAPMQALKRRRLQQVWLLSRHAYRYAAASYTAYRLYEHPWLARAVLTAVWTAAKMAYGIVL